MRSRSRSRKMRPRLHHWSKVVYNPICHWTNISWQLEASVYPCCIMCSSIVSCRTSKYDKSSHLSCSINRVDLAYVCCCTNVRSINKLYMIIVVWALNWNCWSVYHSFSYNYFIQSWVLCLLHITVCYTTYMFSDQRWLADRTIMCCHANHQFDSSMWDSVQTQLKQLCYKLHFRKGPKFVYVFSHFPHRHTV